MKHEFPTPKPNEPSQRAAAFAKAIESTYGNLYGRWMDESEYEDIGEYKKVLQKVADDYDVQVTKMVKKPFSFHFTADGREYKFSPSQWKRIK